MINKYNGYERKYLLKVDYCKTFEKNYPAIALNVLYITKIEICPAFISKINLNCQKQIIILMIPIEGKEG